MGPLKKSVDPAGGRSAAAGLDRRAWEWEAELKAILWEAFGYMDLDSLEARQVHCLVDRALTQRANLIVDMSMAMHPSPAMDKRIKDLTGGFGAPTKPAEAPPIDPEQAATNIVSFTRGRQGPDLLRRAKFLKALERHPEMRPDNGG